MRKIQRFVDFAFLFVSIAIGCAGLVSMVSEVSGQTYIKATISGALCYATQCPTCAAYMSASASSSGTCYVTNSSTNDGDTYLGCQAEMGTEDSCDQTGIEGQKSTCGGGMQWVCVVSPTRSCDVSDCSCSGPNGQKVNPMLSAQCAS